MSGTDGLSDHSAKVPGWDHGGISVEVLLHALTIDCPVAAIQIDERLRVINANRAALNPDGPGYEWQIGRSCVDPLPPRIAAERRPLVERAMQLGQHLIIDGMINGVCTRTCYRPYAQNGDRTIFAVYWPMAWCPEDIEDGDAEHIEARAHDLGPLAKLTERELEVLALVGRGMTNDEIASALHRSVKTVQGHRLSLGVKLQTSNRVQVATTAIKAGLTDFDLDTLRLIWRQSRERGGS